MNRSKLESDIVILDDLLLKEQREIIAIENQLEINELTTDGNDSYFDWRAKAVTATNMKRAKCNSIKRQSNYWRETLKTTEKQLNRALHEKTIESKNKREEEKTKRHKASENKNLKIANQFKKIIKEYLGDEKYVELIQKAEKMVNSEE